MGKLGDLFAFSRHAVHRSHVPYARERWPRLAEHLNDEQEQRLHGAWSHYLKTGEDRQDLIEILESLKAELKDA